MGAGAVAAGTAFRASRATATSMAPWPVLLPAVPPVAQLRVAGSAQNSRHRQLEHESPAGRRGSRVRGVGEALSCASRGPVAADSAEGAASSPRCSASGELCARRAWAEAC